MRPPVTKTHVHFYDMRVQQLTYSWLEPGVPEDEDLGDYGAIRAERYWPDDFLAETRFQGVERIVHVQAAIGTEDPADETRWLQAHHDRLGAPHGAIAYADLCAPDLEDLLQRHLQYPILRGIRDLRYDDYLSDPRWQAGFGRLGELGLVCCDDPLVEHYGLDAQLAARHSETTLCVDHAGFPRQRDDAYFASGGPAWPSWPPCRTSCSRSPASAWRTTRGPSNRCARGCSVGSRRSASSAASSAPTGRSTVCSAPTATCSTPTRS